MQGKVWGQEALCLKRVAQGEHVPERKLLLLSEGETSAIGRFVFTMPLWGCTEAFKLPRF